MVGVTGARGFIGRHLVDALAARGTRVKCLLRPGASPPKPGEPRRGVEVVPGDLTGDPDTLDGFLDGVEVLVHAAGVTHTSDVGVYDRGNAEATTRLLEACSRARVQRVVYLSTIDVALGLRDPYTRSKAAGEAAVHASGLTGAILRPSVVYGPGDTKNLAAVLALIRRTHIAPIPGRGAFRRQPLFVVDLVDLMVEHALGPAWAGVKVLTAVGPDVMTFRDLVRTLAQAVQVTVVPIPVPVGLLRLAGTLAGFIVGENQLERLARGAGDRTASALPSGSPVWIGSTPFAEGLRRTVAAGARAASAVAGPKRLA